MTSFAFWQWLSTATRFPWVPDVTRRAAYGVGVIHGLAGTAHFFGVLPALAFASRLEAISYVASFGVGTVIAMTTFAGIIGWVARHFAASGTPVYRILLLSFSVAAIAVGFVWLV
jgi:sulfite exporter TauE/SafE